MIDRVEPIRYYLQTFIYITVRDVVKYAKQHLGGSAHGRELQKTVETADRS